MKILVLCTGNSCRSQMAEGWLLSWNKGMRVVSAGTNPAAQVHPLAVEVMAEAGIDIGRAYPKDVREYLEEDWDIVLTVCGDAAEHCPRFEGQVTRMIHVGVEDPARVEGTEDHIREEFRRIREELRQKLAVWYVRDVEGRELPSCTCSGNC